MLTSIRGLLAVTLLAGSSLAAMPDADRQTVDTDLGPVEIQRAGPDDGAAPVVLVVHGMPGGCDQAVAMGGFLARAGCAVIAPSRPGYLGTPLEGRESVDAQADLHAALLDALGHERAGVLAWSGGGPSAYRLAVRHPGRVTGLVAAAAVSGPFTAAPPGLDERLMLETSAGNWLLRFLAAHAPKATIQSTLKAEGDVTREQLHALVAEAVADEHERDLVLTMAGAVADRRHRGPGIDNDRVAFGAITSLELERIAAPVLVVNGSADTDVPPAHSDHAAATIPGAQRLILDAGTHLALWVHPHAHQAQERAVALLRH